MTGDAPLTDAIVADATDYKTIGDFAKAIVNNEATVKDVPGLKACLPFAPSSRRKGWGGIKRSYVVGGALGSRGDDIKALVERMI